MQANKGVRSLFGKHIDLPQPFMKGLASEKQKIVDNLFDLFDTSKDGLLSQEEVTHGMSVLGRSISTEELAEIFMFSNKQGLISKADFEKSLTGK